MSLRMANACDAVVAMIDAVPEAPDAARALGAIAELIPLLEHRAAQEQGAPPVRAVYLGAATRIREVQAAESKAAESVNASTHDKDVIHHDGEQDLDDEALSGDLEDDIDDDSDDETDDDDVDDDELHPGTPL